MSLTGFYLSNYYDSSKSRASRNRCSLITHPSIVSRVKPWIRKIAWIGHELVWQHLLPVLAGATSKAVVDALREGVIPSTASPFIAGHLLRAETIDGAVMAAAVPTKAWAKYALPKGLPKNGSKVLAIENEPHFADDFNGVIASGYGKGTKSLLLSDNVIVKVGGRTSIQKINYHVHDADKAGKHWDIVVTGIPEGTKQWELNIPRGEFKGRYAFVTTNRGILVTPMTDHGVRIAKPDYTLRKEELLRDLDPAKVIVERKIDGSLGNAHIQGQRVAFISHRDGGETYYDKLPSLEFIKNNSPFATHRLLYDSPSLTGTVLQGELVHPDGAARVSGILNSLAPNARAIQKERGPVRYYVWDVIKYKGRDISSKPYAERRALCESIVAELRRVNKAYDIVEKAEGETPLAFYTRVISDPLPYGEGVVIKPVDLSAQKWDKMKMTGFGYFKLHEILPGEGKYAGTVGRLVVENPVNGARGEVGSLSVPDEFRNWIWAHRADLTNQLVKIRSQEVTARGVPRAGVFYGFHNGQVDLLMSAEAASGSTDPKLVKPMVYAMKSAAGWRKK